ncbi:pentapeptide repeat-containing protein [Streptomyces sp. NPDC041068]|uniref:pentapeptide repeat-containing protein n=1 Tax=Streptomyces sp. NPDC041068 TaxID=3155130 RepID=UPI0033E9A776
MTDAEQAPPPPTSSARRHVHVAPTNAEAAAVLAQWAAADAAVTLDATYLDLSGADLVSADLYAGDARGARLGAARLDGASLLGATRLEGADLRGASVARTSFGVVPDEHTQLQGRTAAPSGPRSSPTATTGGANWQDVTSSCDWPSTERR